MSLAHFERLTSKKEVVAAMFVDCVVGYMLRHKNSVFSLPKKQCGVEIRGLRAGVRSWRRGHRAPFQPIKGSGEAPSISGVQGDAPGCPKLLRYFVAQETYRRMVGYITSILPKPRPLFKYRSPERRSSSTSEGLSPQSPANRTLDIFTLR